MYVTVTLYNITGVLVRIVSNRGIYYIHQGHILQILTVHPGFCLPQMGRCVIRLSRFFSPFPAANARLYGFRYSGSDIGWTRMKGLIMCRVADFAPLRRQRVVQRRGRASCAPDWPSRTPGRGASGSEKLGKPWQPRKAMEHLWFFFGPFINVYNILGR